MVSSFLTVTAVIDAVSLVVVKCDADASACFSRAAGLRAAPRKILPGDRILLLAFFSRHNQLKVGISKQAEQEGLGK